MEELDVRVFDELGYSAAAPAAELLESTSDELLKRELGDVLKGVQITDKYQDRFAYFSIPRSKAQAAMERANELTR